MQTMSIDSVELRKFGILFAMITMALFGLLLPWWGDRALPAWPFFVGLPLVLLAVLCPAVLLPLYKLWMKIGELLGYINTRIIMTFVFFVMLTPLAWCLRIIGRDLLAREFSKTERSYRVASECYTKAQMEKPY
jgi:hypothetical protein